MSVQSASSSEAGELQLLCWKQERKIKALQDKIKLLEKELGRYKLGEGHHQRRI